MPPAAEGFSFDGYLAQVQQAELTPISGHVVRLVGLLVESKGPQARLGDVCAVLGLPG